MTDLHLPYNDQKTFIAMLTFLQVFMPITNSLIHMSPVSRWVRLFRPKEYAFFYYSSQNQRETVKRWWQRQVAPLTKEIWN